MTPDIVQAAIAKARASKNVERWVDPERLMCDRAQYDAALDVIEASARFPDECPYWGMGPCNKLTCPHCVAKRHCNDALDAWARAVLGAEHE